MVSVFDDLDFLPASELRKLILSRQVSPVDLTLRALERAGATQPTCNAFVSIASDQAMDTARRAEREIMAGGPLGLLHGIPVSVKDLISVAGLPLTFGSRTMAENIGGADAPSAARLRAAGAIIIGKTTTSEYGCTAGALSPLTGATRHPWDTSKSTGGSSAGAAASVAAGVTSLALGTDGGGSIRIPAALTGLVGLKATYGRVPVWPVPAMPGMAHHAPLARNVADAALMLTVVSGYDPLDPFSIPAPVPDYLGACQASVAGLKVAWSPTLGYATPDPAVVTIAEAAVQRFEALGCRVDKVDDVFLEDPAGVWAAEFNTGIVMRMGPLLEKERERLDPTVVAQFEAAFTQTMAEYGAKLGGRFALRDRMRAFFERFDILVSPALPISSYPADHVSPPELAAAGPVAWSQYPYPFNLTGHPAIVVSAGIGSDGMPVGVQIVGRPYAEADVIRAAAGLERTFPSGYNLKPPH